VKADENADAAAQLSAAAVDKLLQVYPHLVEIFQVVPLPDGGCRITLLPASIELSGTYSAVVPPPGSESQ